MIANFTEHSANQRTFLAWIRTGIAVIAFGFVIEKFNLFMLGIASTAGAQVGRTIPAGRLTGPFGHYEGLSLMAVGIVLIAISGWRFVHTSRRIDAPEVEKGNGVLFELLVATVLVLLVAVYCVSIVAR